MPIVVKVARTSLERDRIFSLRRRVFVSEEGYIEDHMASDRLFDRFDILSETINVYAEADGEIVGAIRYTGPNEVGLPVDEYFDFGPTLATLDTPAGAVGWLCIRRDHRGDPSLIMALFKLTTREARRRGVRHIIAAINPEVFPLLQRISAVAVGEPGFCASHGLPFVPIHVDLDGMPVGVREAFRDPVHLLLADSPERRIYRQEEVVFRRGEPGESAFIVMRGSVRVVAEGEDLTPSSGILFGPGQLVGEVALLDDGPRPYTVVGHSKAADLMVWERSTFLQQLQDPGKALEVCRVLGARLRGHLRGFSKQRDGSLARRILVGATHAGHHEVDLRWLAAQCGLWEEQLLGHLSAWTRDGRIEIRGDGRRRRVVLLDEERSRSEVCAA